MLFSSWTILGDNAKNRITIYFRLYLYFPGKNILDLILYDESLVKSEDQCMDLSFHHWPGYLITLVWGEVYDVRIYLPVYEENHETELSP